MPRIASSISHFSAKELSILFKKARRVLTHPGLHVLVAPTKNPHGRILVVTSRKIGNAPTRNRIRRRLKAIFYEERLFEKQVDCIVIVKPGGAQLEYNNLKELLISTLERYVLEKNK